MRREQDARRHRQERYQEEQPEPPLPSTAPSDSLIGWHAIDNLTVLDCAVNPSQMLFDVPHACIAGYAHAQVDVLSRIEDAASSGTEEELARALKWFLALDAIILRTPTRGGSRGNAADIVSQRLRLWRAEDMPPLVQKWRRDTSLAWDRRRLLAERTPTAPSESLRVTRALQLIADGELSRAQAMLLSEGIHDCMDPAVLEQLRSRQPRRTTSMPTTPPTNHEVIATQISLRGVYRDLRRRRGAGVTGGRNEYLKALAISHNDPRADRAIAEHERFALRAYAGHLPAWFLLIWSTCNLTPLKRKPKPGRTAAETPPQPIAVGEPTQRTFAAALTKASTETY